jgi:hypothetical protein
MEYNYLENEVEDIKEYILENYEKEDIEGLDEEELYDELWCADSVTGNGSGSYTFNTWKAEEYICHNMDLVQEAYEEFGYEGIPKDTGAEAMDVTIRCYLLGQAIEKALEELKEEVEE